MNNGYDNNNSSRKIRLEDLKSFSDAIFAFSITFMAISIVVPNIPTQPHDRTAICLKIIAVDSTIWDLCDKFYGSGRFLDFIPSYIQLY